MEDVSKKYKLTVGVEVHAELKTKTKMFCSCLNDPDVSRPNINVCPICMGHPGTLPVPNRKAIEAVIKVGMALACDIAEHSHFDRKNYFYPDLPKGYQITQYEEPFCRNGKLAVPGSPAIVRINRIHLEEDTGKSIHSKDATLLDFNRAGVPLMELVTEPDLHSATDVKKFCEELQLMLRYLGVSDADMEKGHMRCEANISVSKTDEFGKKVEVKNLNSFKAVERAIEYECKRHIEALENGEKVVQETRGWDDGKGVTYSQRSKEEAHDYRYFPEPDIPPLSIFQNEHAAGADEEAIFIDALRSELPELPASRRERFLREYGLAPDQIEIFTVQKPIGDYFEGVASELASEHDRGEFSSLDASRQETGDDLTHLIGLHKLAANYLINDLPRALTEAGTDFADLKISAENFAEFVLRIEKGVLSSASARTVLTQMLQTGADPDEIIRDKNLAQISDTGELEVVVAKLIEDNPLVVEDFKKGKQNALQFFVGQVMKETKGKANPKVAQELLRKKLSS
ncbi:MAG: Asp-tRNA(Asn)/Glu-tRNA(Gln) amidotransferase subunit GatB [bacterium]|nr:Asp-tRNA(Asn)/Glu-tRNA(Gln) amidotransferase subunit GatB [bacterium]